MNNQLKVLRASHQWTQEDLANRLGRGARQTIIAIEKGKFDPSLPLAFKAARLFELPVEELFSDQD
jgi:putative transcriptional regulator